MERFIFCNMFFIIILSWVITCNAQVGQVVKPEVVVQTGLNNSIHYLELNKNKSLLKSEYYPTLEDHYNNTPIIKIWDVISFKELSDESSIFDEYVIKRINDNKIKLINSKNSSIEYSFNIPKYLYYYHQIINSY
ncbi:hypothetical protein ACFLSQ_10310 [Bacteroidota bacterium]